MYANDSQRIPELKDKIGFFKSCWKLLVVITLFDQYNYIKILAKCYLQLNHPVHMMKIVFPFIKKFQIQASVNLIQSKRSPTNVSKCFATKSKETHANSRRKLGFEVDPLIVWKKCKDVQKNVENRDKRLSRKFETWLNVKKK